MAVGTLVAGVRSSRSLVGVPVDDGVVQPPGMVVSSSSCLDQFKFLVWSMNRKTSRRFSDFCGYMSSFHIDLFCAQEVVKFDFASECVCGDFTILLHAEQKEGSLFAWHWCRIHCDIVGRLV